MKTSAKNNDVLLDEAPGAGCCVLLQPATASGLNVIGICSSGIWRIPFLSSLLDNPLRRLRLGTPDAAGGLSAVAGWGRRSTTKRARDIAGRHDLPFIALEDGFLRSFGTGQHFPPLSIVVDEQGIYYDSTCASALERLLASSADVLAGIADDVARARALVLAHRLSKYNHAPVLDLAEFHRLGPQTLPHPGPLPQAGEGANKRRAHGGAARCHQSVEPDRADGPGLCGDFHHGF